MPAPAMSTLETEPDTLVEATNRSLQAAANRHWVDSAMAHQAALSLMTAFTRTATLVEMLGWSSDCIKSALAPSRKAFAESVFMKRCQQWPRGYPGDFETIEYLAGAVNRSDPESIGWYFEQILLQSPATRQHRNKLNRQTVEIVNGIKRRPDARIFSLACGGCLDWIPVLPDLVGFAGEIVLNDCEPAALELAESRFSAVTRRYRLVPGNILRVARHLADLSGFDLTIAGGLFDYLSDRAVVSLLRTIHGRLLAPNGVQLFTNMAEGNPWRTLMQYGSDWPIIERSEALIRGLCAEAGIGASEVEMTRDGTGLALLVRVVRGA